MKGIIFRAFEDFVVAQWGEAFYEELLDATPAAAPGVFVAPGTYPDAVLVALLQAAVGKLGIDLADALRSFGRFAFTPLAASLPGCIEGHAHPLSLLEAIDRIVHVEVRKLYPDATTPRMALERTGEHTGILHYASPRKLCPLLVGLLEGACEVLHHRVSVAHEQCMHDGFDACRLRLTFVPLAAGERLAAVAAAHA